MARELGSHRGDEFCTERILSYSICTECADEIARKALEGEIHHRGFRYIACMNPHSYATSKHDELFASALHTASCLLPDGFGMVLASRILGGRVASRVTGMDLFDSVNRYLEVCGGGRVFFLGSTESVLERIKARFAYDYPSLTFVGAYSPPFCESFSSRETEVIVRLLRDARADVIWVGLTAPKQEKLLLNLVGHLNTGLGGAIGAVFDFYAGTVSRPGKKWQDLGLEWLPRLVREPERLWRRMVFSAPIFLTDVAMSRFRRLIDSMAK